MITCILFTNLIIWPEFRRELERLELLSERIPVLILREFSMGYMDQVDAEQSKREDSFGGVIKASEKTKVGGGEALLHWWQNSDKIYVVETMYILYLKFFLRGGLTNNSGLVLLLSEL